MQYKMHSTKYEIKQNIKGDKQTMKDKTNNLETATTTEAVTATDEKDIVIENENTVVVGNYEIDMKNAYRYIDSLGVTRRKKRTKDNNNAAAKPVYSYAYHLTENVVEMFLNDFLERTDDEADRVYIIDLKEFFLRHMNCDKTRFKSIKSLNNFVNMLPENYKECLCFTVRNYNPYFVGYRFNPDMVRIAGVSDIEKTKMLASNFIGETIVKVTGFGGRNSNRKNNSNKTNRDGLHYLGKKDYVRPALSDLANMFIEYCEREGDLLIESSAAAENILYEVLIAHDFNVCHNSNKKRRVDNAIMRYAVDNIMTREGCGVKNEISYNELVRLSIKEVELALSLIYALSSTVANKPLRERDKTFKRIYEIKKETLEKVLCLPSRDQRRFCIAISKIAASSYGRDSYKISTSKFLKSINELEEYEREILAACAGYKDADTLIMKIKQNRVDLHNMLRIHNRLQMGRLDGFVKQQ